MRFHPKAKLAITILILVIFGLNSWFNKPSSSYEEYLAATAPVAPDDLFLGEQILPPVPVPEIDLIDYTGEIVSLTDYKGKIILLSFAYTSCPDVCPVIFGKYLELQTELKDAIGTDIELIFITVDPEVDTPDRLAAHVKAMGGKWRFLSQDLAIMEQVWAAFGMHVEKEDPIVYHTNLSFLIDQKGLVRIQYTGFPPTSAFLSDINKILTGK